jgi:hypothetical protein
VSFASSLGATLAIDAAAHMIVLSRTVMTRELTADDLLELIQRFCASAMYWTTTLAAAMPNEMTDEMADALPPLFAAAMADVAEDGPAATGSAQAPGYPAYVRG